MKMKHLLLTTIAAVLVVGCGPSVDIHQAAKDGNIEAIKQHLDAGTDVNEKSEPNGFTSLHIAAGNGHKEIVVLLIANGAEVNAKIYGGKTPLDLAIFRNHPELAELLIAKGADLNAKDNNGRTPLDFAIGMDRTELADLLRKHGGKTSEELKAEGK